MTSTNDKELVNANTLRAIAAQIGNQQLLDKLEASGISRWTAKEMLKGTWQKQPRAATRRCLVNALREFGASEADLLTRYRIEKAVKAS